MQSRYIEGMSSDNGWLTWKSKQSVYSSEYFVHSTYYLQGRPANATEYTIKKIIEDRFSQSRSNMKIALQKEDTVRWETIERYINSDVPYGASFYTGAQPVIIWQNPLDGNWMMATGYGISIGFEVSIKAKYEWKLREKPLIGFIYWMGPGYRSNFQAGLTRMLHRKEIIVPWYNVHLDVWGRLADTGIKLGGAQWQPLSEMPGSMMVGGINVVRNVAPTSVINEEYKSWAVEQVSQGKGLIYHTRKQGKKSGDETTVWQVGTQSEKIEISDYERIMDQITVNVEHDKNGRILYKRQ